MRRMTQAALAMVTIVGLVGGAASFAFTSRTAASETIYTPTQFAALHMRSKLKIGQRLRIKGALTSFWPNAWPSTGAIFETQGTGRIGVFVSYGAPNSVVSRLRALPLLGPLVPPTADHPIIGKFATFRVRAVACAATNPVCTFRSPALQLQDGGS